MTDIKPAPPFRVCNLCLDEQACSEQRVCAFELRYPEVFGPDDPVPFPAASDNARPRPAEPESGR